MVPCLVFTSRTHMVWGGVTPLSTTHPPHLTPTTSTRGVNRHIYIYTCILLRYMHIYIYVYNTHIYTYRYTHIHTCIILYISIHVHIGTITISGEGGPPNDGPYTYMSYVYIYIYKQHAGVIIYFPACLVNNYVLLLRDPCWGDHHFDPT